MGVVLTLMWMIWAAICVIGMYHTLPKTKKAAIKRFFYIS